MIFSAPGMTSISAVVYSPPFSPSRVHRNGFSQDTDSFADLNDTTMSVSQSWLTMKRFIASRSDRDFGALTNRQSSFPSVREATSGTRFFMPPTEWVFPTMQ